MITAIEIENFKGIGTRQRIELRPLTLLFGANSAGKSSLLHAIHYAREVFERHNLDADQTIGGGPFVDLGGFRNFVHGRDRGQTVSLRLELDFADGQWPVVIAMPAVPDVDAIDVSGAVKSAAVEIGIGWSDARESYFVSRYSIDVNDSPLATIECNFGRRTVEITALNTKHELFIPGFAAGEYCHSENESTVEYWYRDVTGDELDPRRLIPLAGQRDALPRWGQLLGLVIPHAPRPSRKPRQPRLFKDIGPTHEQLEISFDDEEDVDEGDFSGTAFFRLLTELIVGPGQAVCDRLRKLRYLGPVRETPPREYAPPRFPDSARWADGLGAWDLLHSGTNELVTETNAWLADEERLNAGCQVIRKHVKELDTTDPLVVQLMTGRAFDEAEDARINLAQLPTHRRLVIRPLGGNLELRPHDIGIGISQVVPVVVTALDGQDRLLAIEQPELHLHPRLQAELGDLFIESALGDRKHRILLETHSEHLILRLLRRIRETANDKPHRGLLITEADIAIYYAKSHQGDSVFTRIDVDKNGDFIQPWPDDFFEIDFYERFGDAG